MININDQFTTTMDDIIAEAKSTGEFEGSVEDIRATSIEQASAPETIASDLSSGALTKLVTFNIDRGCSLSRLSMLCLDLIPKSYSSVLEPTLSVAKSGLYMSKRKFAGRTLVLFARRKVQLSTTEDEVDDANLIDYDPMKLMVLTRPNTGTNPFEMPTADLEQKYKLVASLDDISKLWHNGDDKDEDCAESLVKLMTKAYPTFTNMWVKIFEQSDKFQGELGLAPRRSKLGIVTGAVLHCLPALEKAFAMRRVSAERSLKVIRVETTSNGVRTVGFKIPIDEEALRSILEAMALLKVARSGVASSELLFNEIPGKIQAKSVAWLTIPPKTMLSFFTKTSASRSSTEKKTNTSDTSSCNPNKRNLPALESSRKKILVRAKSKPKSMAITSFFKKEFE